MNSGEKNASPEVLTQAAKELAQLYRTDTMFYVYDKTKAVTRFDFWGQAEGHKTFPAEFDQLRDISHRRRDYPSEPHGAVESQFAEVEFLDTKLLLIDIAMKRLGEIPGKFDPGNILKLEDLDPVPGHMAEELAEDAYASGGLKQMRLERVMLSILSGRLQLSEPEAQEPQ